MAICRSYFTPLTSLIHLTLKMAACPQSRLDKVSVLRVALAKSKRATQGPRCLPLLWQVPKMFLDASDGGCVGAFSMLGGSVQLIATIHRSCEITGWCWWCHCRSLGVTIRAMADGTLDSRVGARICNGLGIMRTCLETQKLEQLESRMDENCRPRLPMGGQGCARKDSTYEAQRLSH